METAVIKYNLRERGRQHRGKERSFNIRAIANYINGPACQERVKNRDLHGYYGHWVRLKFGMNPVEGGFIGGKAVQIEPALVTTMLRAHEDGTIEHQAEFLDNDPGKVAAKLHAGRVGGFSSAIDPKSFEFFGFDYVLEPNYSTNRGYALDDVRDMTVEDIEAAIYDEQLRGVVMLLDGASAERDHANEVIERLRAENDELVSLLAAKGINAQAALDSVSMMPVVVPADPMQRILRDASAFKGATLPQFVVPKEPAQEEQSPLYGRLLNRF